MSELPSRSIPLAWRNLTENRWRLLASVAGTALAVVLMFVENGFRTALLISSGLGLLTAVLSFVLPGHTPPPATVPSRSRT